MDRSGDLGGGGGGGGDDDNGGNQEKQSIENYVNYVVGNDNEHQQQQQLNPENSYKKQTMTDDFGMASYREIEGKDAHSSGGQTSPNQSFNGQEQENYHRQEKMIYNTNIEPVFRESQTVFSKDKPDAKLLDEQAIATAANSTAISTTVATSTESESQPLLATRNSTAKV